MAIACQDLNKFILLFAIVYIEITINHFIQISRRLELRKNYMYRKKLDFILIIDTTSGGF